MLLLDQIGCSGLTHLEVGQLRFVFPEKTAVFGLFLHDPFSVLRSIETLKLDSRSIMDYSIVV